MNNELQNKINEMLSTFNNEICDHKKNYSYNIQQLWHNVYNIGDFQEVHHHMSLDRQAAFSFVYLLSDGLSKDLSGNHCYPVIDKNKNPSYLFFNNPRHSLHVSSAMSQLFECQNYDYHYIPEMDEGTLIIFPSYMEHGVSVHKSDLPRITISGNLVIC